MSLERRLALIQRMYLATVIRPIALEFDVDPDELIEDARRFFTLSDAQQDAEFAACLEHVQAEGDEEAVRVLTDGWAAIRSYR